MRAREAPRAALLGRLRLVGPLLLITMAGAVAMPIPSPRFLDVLIICLTLILGLFAATTVVCRLQVWRPRTSSTENRIDLEELTARHSFSVVVPARREDSVLEGTLSRLITTDHPHFEVLVVVGADDTATREVADRFSGLHPDLVKVVLDGRWPDSDPRALEAALPFCTGTITGVFDAEHDLHPALLQRVDQCFQKTNADIVHAGPRLTHSRSSWLSVRKLLEYYVWLGRRVHLDARQRLVPISGNTVFVRSHLLRAVRGLDAGCVAESREVSDRPSGVEAHTIVFDEPEVKTPEESRPRGRAFLSQQTRWNQGLLQTVSRNHGGQLPLRQRAVGVHMLAVPYVLALAWLTIPVSIVTALVAKAPVHITPWALLTAVLLLLTLVTEIAGLTAFRRSDGERPSVRDVGRRVLGLPLYHAVLAFAAARAVALEAREAAGRANLRVSRALLIGFGMIAATASVVVIIYASLFLHLLAVGIAQTVRARGWGILVSVGVSVMLAASAWSALGAMRQSWRLPHWLAAVREGLESEHRSAAGRKPRWLPGRPQIEALLARWYVGLHPKLAEGTAIPNPVLPRPLGQTDTVRSSAGTCDVADGMWREFARGALVFAVAASAVWLAWHKPGPWEDCVVIAAAGGLAIRGLRRIQRRGGPGRFGARTMAAFHFLRRTAPIRFVERQWRALPANARPILPLLALLNVLIGVEAASAMLFVAMAGVDLVVLNQLTRTSSPAPAAAVDAPAPPAPAPPAPARTVTIPEPTVPPPSRIANRSPWSMAIGSIWFVAIGWIRSSVVRGHRVLGKRSARTPQRSNEDVRIVRRPGESRAVRAPSPSTGRRAWSSSRHSLVAPSISASPAGSRASGDARGVASPSNVVRASVQDTQPPDGPPSRHGRLAAKVQPLVTGAVLFVAVGWIAYARPGPALIPAVLVFGLAIPSIADVEHEPAIKMVLSIAVVVATVDYVSWRFGVTNWQGWWIAAPLLFAEAFGALHVLGFQLTVWPWPESVLEPRDDPTRYPIFIFVPTLNEGPGVLWRTLQGCIAARQRYVDRHPDAHVTIVVCNDGRVANAPCWEDTDALAQQLGVSCVTRTEPGGAKAGNLENARQEVGATGDSLLVIFDADQVPKPDFLLKTVPPFADRSVGWVQTGQYYANLANPVSRWADDQQSMFYNLLCPGKAAMNAAFICGTNVVIRTTALDEIGGLPQDSVTEDFAASIMLHPKWRSVYVSDILATGLGPLDLPSYFKQQSRWALGTLGVLRSNWRDIFLPKRNGLSLGQRAQYFLACTHYLCGLRDLIYLVSPLLFIATGVPAVQRATLSQYLFHFLPYAFLGLFAMWYAGRGVTGMRGIIIGFGSFPALLGSLVAVVLKRRSAFATTSKKSQGQVSFAPIRVHVALVLLCVAGLVWATMVSGEQATSLFISVLWVLYSLVLLGSFLWLALADTGLSAATSKWGAADEVAAKLPYPSKLLRRPDSFKPGWNVGLAALMATPLLVGGHLASLPVFSPKGPAASFVISHETAGPPYIGLSVPTPLLLTRPAVLERRLGTRFSIVGRTQDVQDNFDVSWADRLAAHGSRPWITLEFGVFGPRRRRPLDASLPAIINGVHDGDLARWAAEIRDFGKPVYLTILRHTDKNWALTSAVTAGGIPEDVPRAWNHVRSIFRAVGARNVAWVWAPADPVNDQAYAPAPAAIDVVLQSFVNYPGTRWGDPGLVLGQLTQRYPGKPLFVEASVPGRSSAKAAWLARLGQALASCSQLYAFLYHEGGPELRPTAEQTNTWSFASDPLSLAATQNFVANLRTEMRAR